MDGHFLRFFIMRDCHDSSALSLAFFWEKGAIEMLFMRNIALKPFHICTFYIIGIKLRKGFLHHSFKCEELFNGFKLEMVWHPLLCIMNCLIISHQSSFLHRIKRQQIQIEIWFLKSSYFSLYLKVLEGCMFRNTYYYSIILKKDF